MPQNTDAYTPPTPEEDEAFEALSRAQEHQRDPAPEPWVWLTEGEYTETQLRNLVESFGRMRTAHAEAMRPLGGGH